MKQTKLQILFCIVIITMLYGCHSLEKQPTDTQIDWITLCVKQHQITDSEISEFSSSIEKEFNITNNHYTFRGIVKDVFKNIFDNKKITDVMSTENSYGDDYLRFDYNQMKLLFDKVKKYVDGMTVVIYGYSPLEVERYSPSGTYDLFTFNAVYGGNIVNYFFRVSKDGTMYLQCVK